jgi:hypothetical protein
MYTLLVIALTVSCIFELLVFFDRSPLKDKLPPHFRETLNRWRNVFARPEGFLTLLFGMAVAYFGWIDSRVHSMINYRDFIAQVARRARPSMVFDAEGKILADTGVQSLLKNDPEVQSARQGETNYHTKIILHPKAVLASEPILESLDLGNVSITPEKSVALAGRF